MAYYFVLLTLGLDGVGEHFQKILSTKAHEVPWLLQVCLYVPHQEADISIDLYCIAQLDRRDHLRPCNLACESLPTSAAH